MEVDLLVLGARVVHDVGDALDIDATGGDVGRDEYVDLAAAERAQRLLPCSLPQVAVDSGRGKAPVGQLLGHLSSGPLRAAEHHREAAALGEQQPR
jgi:hypothetical protein